MSYKIDLKSDNILNLGCEVMSKGNQVKFYDFSTKSYIKGQFIYQDTLWKDYMVEYLSFILGSQLNVSTPIVRQEVVTLSNNLHGVISKDFAINEQWVPMCELFNYEKLLKAYNKPYTIFIKFVEVFIDYGIERRDAEDYFITMIVLDFLLGNEDRHYNNFGLLRNNDTGEYSIAPLFDFGLGLFEHDLRYHNRPDLFTAKSKMVGLPFCRDLSKAFDMCINVFGKEFIKEIVKDLQVPDRELFPSDLAFEYFLDSYNYIMRKVGCDEFR